MIAELDGLEAKITLRKILRLETATMLGGLRVRMGRLKAVQAQTPAELDAMLPSILGKAFKGKL